MLFVVVWSCNVHLYTFHLTSGMMACMVSCLCEELFVCLFVCCALAVSVIFSQFSFHCTYAGHSEV